MALSRYLQLFRKMCCHRATRPAPGSVEGRHGVDAPDGRRKVRRYRLLNHGHVPEWCNHDRALTGRRNEAQDGGLVALTAHELDGEVGRPRLGHAQAAEWSRRIEATRRAIG